MADRAYSTDTPDRRPATPTGTGGRRGLAAGIAALALTGAGVMAAPAKAHPDEALLRLGERLVVAWRDHDAAWVLANNEQEDDGPLTTEACRLEQITDAIAEEIEGHTATTTAGLLVKLRASFATFGKFEWMEREGPLHERLLAGVSDDLAAMDVTMRGLA